VAVVAATAAALAAAVTDLAAATGLALAAAVVSMAVISAEALVPSAALTTMTTMVSQAAGGAHALTDGSVTDGYPAAPRGRCRSLEGVTTY
jgi:hypothetical protein